MKLQHTAKDLFWQDESGLSVPYNRTTPLERKKERLANKLVKSASKVYDILAAFKEEIIQANEEVLETIRQENDVKLDGKGNFTWYNFNRTIKIEVNVNEAIKFDEIKIEAAKEKLINMIRENISGDDFIISIVEDAFQTSRGKLDARKILGLQKHTSRIKSKDIKDKWENAMELINQSITRPKSKSYQKVWVKDDEGAYKPIELNFSAL
ncbi:DUF3164 family protein [Chryseobacterium sp. 09-1422]|uniref:DUF3164 family protein n=1 Tax=Chryseobacterium kimseyorum TaxID=2984028 RepID=A0ABT3HYT9_9FLAO|nr:DUF3164 family protein [Chryseobacterium kimseyorum]MCW3168936.1 DUF3164 family protein [Chryseobacterium kimseyorum]